MDQRPSVVVNLDDLCIDCISNKTFEMLDGLRRVYPDFKVTLFTIPWKSPTPWLVEIQKLRPWIEFAIHGTAHEDMTEFCIDRFDDMKSKFTTIRSIWQSGPYAKGFKAPQWALSKPFYNVLVSHGFYVAVNRKQEYPDHGLNYRYDIGQELAYDMHYRSGSQYRWHGHIQDCYNGLPNRFETMKMAWPKNAKFFFISEVVNGSY